MLNSDVMNQLLLKHRLTDTGTAEQTDLAALRIRAEKINDLDTRLQDFGRTALLRKARRLPVNRPLLRRLHIAQTINRLTQDIEHPSQDFITDRNLDRRTRIDTFHTAHQTIGRTHRNAPDNIVADMLRNLGNHLPIRLHNVNLIQNRRQMIRMEADIYHRSNDLNNFASICHMHFPLSLYGI